MLTLVAPSQPQLPILVFWWDKRWVAAPSSSAIPYTRPPSAALPSASFIDRSPSKHLELVHSHAHDVVLAVSAAWWWYHDGRCSCAWFAIKSSTESLDSMIEWNGMECSIRLGESLGQCIIPRLDCEGCVRGADNTRDMFSAVGSTIRTTRCTSMFRTLSLSLSLNNLDCDG